MAPLIRDGDVLTVAPLERRAPRLGDVVAFTTPRDGRLAIHRVVGRVDDGWLLRGDNAPRADGVVARSDILGVVTSVEREGRLVRLGLGPEAAAIAGLSRAGAWPALMRSSFAARRVAAAIVRRAQGVPLWRAAGRSLGLRYTVGVASPEEVRTAQRRLDPDARAGTLAPSANVVDWVAKRRGRIIGFVQYVCHDEEAGPWAGHWLFSLTVWQPFRALGVGEALTREVIVYTAGRGADELRLVVSDDNGPAIALYRKLGFERTVVPALEPALEEEERQTGRRRVVMRRRLASTAATAGSDDARASRSIEGLQP